MALPYFRSQAAPIGRGLDVARRLQRSMADLRQARRRVKQASGGGRRACRESLAELIDCMEQLEHDLLTSGATTDVQQDVRFLLDDIDDRVHGALFKNRIKPRHVRRLRAEAQSAMLRVDALRLTAAAPPR